MLDPEVRHRTLQLLGVETRKYNPGQLRDPGGEGGGRWVKNPAAGAADAVKKAVSRTAADAGAFHQDLAEVQDLVDAIDSGEVSSRRLVGGEMGAVELVEHKNGKSLVHKILMDVSGVMGAETGDPVRQADAEQLGGQLGQLIGAPVPRVLRTDFDEIWMDQLEGRDLGTMNEEWLNTLGGVAAHYKTRDEIERLADTDEGLRLGVFDLLTANWDRNKYSNIFVRPDGTPGGIDHSFLWGGNVDADPDVPPQHDTGGGAISPFAERFAARQPDGTMAWVDNDLTPADVDWLRDQLAEVEGDFDAAGRHDWWEWASARLEAIAPHATGTEDVFAT